MKAAGYSSEFSADTGFFCSQCFSVAFQGARPLECHNKFNTGCSPTARVSWGRGKQRRKGYRAACVSLHMSRHYRVGRRCALRSFHWKRLNADRNVCVDGDSVNVKRLCTSVPTLIVSTWSREILVMLCHQIL